MVIPISINSVSLQIRGAHLLIASLAICCLGCPAKAPDEFTAAPEPASRSEPAKPLRLIVIEDPELAAAAQRQWQARYEIGLEIVSWDRQQAERAFDSGEPLAADAIIYPTDLMAGLIETGIVAEMPAFVTRESFANNDYAADDLLPIVSDVVTKWGTTTYAVPFGQPVLLLGYRADILKHFAVEPPSTWDELSQLCGLVAEYELGEHVEAVPKFALAQPLSRKWAAATVLARAAPAAKSPARFSTLFDLRSMRARMQSAPFVSALEHTLSDQQFGSSSALNWTPEEACLQLRQGRCVFAIGWPSKTDSSQSSVANAEIRFTMLPGSERVFSMSSDEWSKTETGQLQRVTYLPGVGRLGSVIARSRRQRAAWGLLVRLSGREWGSTVASASLDSSIFRLSQVGAVDRWLGDGWNPASANSYADAMKQALSTPSAISAPRLPRNARYMAVLQEHIHQSLNTNLQPAKAMQATEIAWDEITEELGRAAQSAAYHRSLGLEP